jgi:hypothetical protein
MPWVTSTRRVIFGISFALQRLGFKLINQIAGQKPDPRRMLSTPLSPTPIRGRAARQLVGLITQRSQV